VVGPSYEELDANALVAACKQTQEEASDAGVQAQTDILVGWSLIDAQEEFAK